MEEGSRQVEGGGGGEREPWAGSPSVAAWLAAAESDLRDQLGVVVGFAELLARNPSLPPAARAMASHALESGWVLARALERLQALAHAEAFGLSAAPGASHLPLARRPAGSLGEPPATAGPALRLGCGQWLDPRRYGITIGSVVVRLTPPQYTLLRALAQRPGEVLTRGMLAEYAWPGEGGSHDRQIETHLARIRARVRQAGLAALDVEAVRGVGYRLRVGPEADLAAEQREVAARPHSPSSSP